MDDDLPYMVEYAKSDRSKCQLCKQSIMKMSLRLAAVIQVYVELRQRNRANILCLIMLSILAINGKHFIKKRMHALSLNYRSWVMINKAPDVVNLDNCVTYVLLLSQFLLNYSIIYVQLFSLCNICLFDSGYKKRLYKHFFAMLLEKLKTNVFLFLQCNIDAFFIALYSF